MGNFAIDIGEFVAKTQKRADQLVQKLAIDSYEKVRLKTPVDTGQLRASWTVSVNHLPSSFNGSNSQTSSAKFGDTIYIATDKVYAPMLEYGLYPQPGTAKTVNGYSVQAPQGMVRITAQEVASWLKQNAGRFS
ncbi:HK97 gp10 family phage protein [Lonepinella koalarum]|uniref:HK97 gp10 family phage protein n=1 Tax=Lonepinella koalarum TaxID=53417 RepID=UPI0011E49B9C|nr:HK97 gp10 family phage protein [Lonepinella koalarum]TYG33323.1 HK97 gp10 family phage protein [Lonepinella koalarum]